MGSCHVGPADDPLMAHSCQRPALALALAHPDGGGACADSLQVLPRHLLLQQWWSGPLSKPWCGLWPQSRGEKTSAEHCVSVSPGGACALHAGLLQQTCAVGCCPGCSMLA